MTLPHHTLVAWQRADALFIRIHRLSQAFPATERYELGSQLRRAAFSVPANIVEGFGREQPADRLHFLLIARASLAEVGYCVDAAHRLGYLTDPEFASLDLEIRRTSAPLLGLIRSIQAQIKQATRPKRRQ